MGIAATSERHIKSLRSSVWLARLAIRGTRSRPGATLVANCRDRASLGLVLLLCRPNGATPHQSTRASPHRGDLNQFYLTAAALLSGAALLLLRALRSRPRRFFRGTRARLRAYI